MTDESSKVISAKNKILILSHKQQLCGVHEYGLNIAEAVKKSVRYSFIYAECSDPNEYRAAISLANPDAIIYNYYSSTMPWLTRRLMMKFKVPHIGIMHEVTQQKADEADDSLFHFYIAPDPTLLLKNPIVFKTGRLIPSYNKSFSSPSVPTIGSFGFGTRGKGFERVIRTVQQEFDEAQILLHIPFAAFGDAAGSEARAIAERCKSIIVKTGIKLSISHDFLNTQQLLDFLAHNTVNAFFYDETKGRGISSVSDMALAVQRPIALSRSSMFRHLFSASPSIFIEDVSLKQIIQNGIEPLIPYRAEWSEENIIWDYERIIDKVLAREIKHFRLDYAFPVLRSIYKRFRMLKWKSTLEKADSWVPQIHSDIKQSSHAQRRTHQFAPLDGETHLNRILDNSARKQYEPIIKSLFNLVPDMMEHKLLDANIQQAFVLDTVYKFASRLTKPSMLCIGSYDDTASASLVKLGFQLTEIDPVLNYDLDTFFHKPTTVKGSFDIIFSTSVIEHVRNDELFISQIVDLLAPNGVVVITCDYNDQYKPGDPIPSEDFRFYTQNDFRKRLLPLLKGCSLIDEPQWDCPKPDFHYAGCNYTFATFVFKKKSS